MTDNNQPDKTSPVGRTVFTIMTIATIIMGLAIYLLNDWWGIDKATAALIGAAFLLVGLVDVIILKKWDRIFRPRDATKRD
ncbi:MAG: hypothetical protein ACR2O4_07965 [Hyphomicrobiaceae bacterium]